MRDIFTYLCNFSVVTSIAIVVAVLLRPVLKKGPSFIRCALWALVFLRLLIPVGFSDLPFSVPTVFEAEETIMAPEDEAQAVVSPKDEVVKEEVKEENEGKEENNVIQQAPSKPVQKPISGTVTEPQKPQNAPVADTPIEENTATPKAENKVDVIKVLSVIWAVGAVLMLGYMLVSNLVLKYRVRGAIVYDSRIRVLDRDCSPFVFGFFRPIIYIPASAKRSDWGYIIAHESTHIKRLDHIVKPLAFLALCLYWYNPLVWAAYILFSKDIEYACDERTVKTMESEDKKAYSLALLSVSQSTGRIFAPLSFGEVSVKERIKRVMKFRNSLWAIALTAVICISLIAFIACSPAADESNESYDEESSDVSSESTKSSDETVEEKTKLSIGYATEEEKANVAPTITWNSAHERGDDELIKIEVNKTVKDFKFVEIHDDMSPHGEHVVFELDELTPDSPFYLQTSLKYWRTSYGVRFNDENGNAVCAQIKFTIEYGELEEIFTNLHFEIIESEFTGLGNIEENILIVYEPQFSDSNGELTYITHLIKQPPTAENIVRYCIEKRNFPEGSEMLSFEIRDRVGYLDMNAKCFELSNTYHDNFGIPAVKKTFVANFDIDRLVITYNGIDPTAENTVKPNITVFNTENISSITFYSYSGNGVGSTVEDKYMAEIINWLKTFTVGERYPDEPLDGDGHIVIEITYADGTVIKDTMDTVLVNGVVYYTDHGGYPDCYWEILSRTKLEPEYKTTEEKTNYALEKTYTLSGETVDADYAKYCYLGEYSGDYTWCDYDLNKMTDGVVGDITAADYASDPFGVPGVTVMFAGTNRLFEYIIDLGDHYEDINSFVFRNVRIGGNRGFKVRLAYVSDDNVNFTKVTGTTTEAKINTTNDEYFDCTYKLDTPAKGRYVRILLNLQNCYVLQLEEIEIWNK